MEGVVYIYEYVLVFFSKSWVCLGIQGHTPGAATGHDTPSTPPSDMLGSTCGIEDEHVVSKQKVTC